MKKNKIISKLRKILNDKKLRRILLVALVISLIIFILFLLFSNYGTGLIFIFSVIIQLILIFGCRPL